ncbi:hypothetical protein [Comamonas sp. NLF-1-9]|uniref:hypothetical protein n=1 Tax=Comamonas sp. NLF-1-9 TaxID=2853163 RepID=UPI001C48F01F|nr:hypothetical protein [Comamonas sp. NLF-1-9]QXL85328.1 hypothetical protein KUD94_04985 [Comamonas sp. NLF-1-9]
MPDVFCHGLLGARRAHLLRRRLGDYADLFADLNISEDMKRPYEQRTVPVQPLLREEAQKLWDEFRNMPDRAKYCIATLAMPSLSDLPCRRRPCAR